MRKNMTAAIVYMAIFFIGLIADQLTKYWVTLRIKPHNTVALVENVLHFTYSENTGAAFSIFRGMQSFLVILTSIGMALIFVYMVKIKGDGKALLQLSLALILAGGVGNLIDRLRLGYVIDFIDVRLINFAIFNVADILISVGVFLIIVDSLFVSKTLMK